VWITKYRYKVLTYDIKKRVRELVLQVAEEMGIKVENGVVSSDHVHVFVEIPPNIKISDFVQKAKGRSSKKIQEEFPILRKKYWVDAYGEEAILARRAVM
jgi:putative transposase